MRFSYNASMNKLLLVLDIKELILSQSIGELIFKKIAYMKNPERIYS